jgi:hypothetical protein
MVRYYYINGYSPGEILNEKAEFVQERGLGGGILNEKADFVQEGWAGSPESATRRVKQRKKPARNRRRGAPTEGLAAIEAKSEQSD